MTAVNEGSMLPGYESWDKWAANYMEASPPLRVMLWKKLIEKIGV